jgi:hypothetical protein
MFVVILSFSTRTTLLAKKIIHNLKHMLIYGNVFTIILCYKPIKILLLRIHQLKKG